MQVSSFFFASDYNHHKRRQKHGGRELWNILEAATETDNFFGVKKSFFNDGTH